MTLADADRINKYISWGGDQLALARIENCIKYSITVGVYHVETNTLASWSILIRYGAIGMVGTHPDYRRKGLAKAVITSLCLKLLDNNIIPHAYINETNVASCNLFQSLGFELFRDCQFYWAQVKERNGASPTNENTRDNHTN